MVFLHRIEFTEEEGLVLPILEIETVWFIGKLTTF